MLKNKTLICTIIFLLTFVSLSSTLVSKAAVYNVDSVISVSKKKTVSAKDIVNQFKKGWEKNYNREEASMTRNYFTKLLGKNAVSYIDKNYKNIKIDKKGSKDLSKNEMAMVLGLMQVKYAELKDSQNPNKQEISALQANCDTAYQILSDIELDDRFNSINDVYIYRQPTLADSNTSSTDSIDGLITDSNNFISKGSNDRIKEESIQDFSKTLYNILITIATVVSVIIGGILGIKIMLASAEEKAQVKELLVPYVIGCVVVFGAFGIWKLVVNILQNI